jgi:hypothetical protein
VAGHWHSACRSGSESCLIATGLRFRNLGPRDRTRFLGSDLTECSALLKAAESRQAGTDQPAEGSAEAEAGSGCGSGPVALPASGHSTSSRELEAATRKVPGPVTFKLASTGIICQCQPE